VSQSKGGKRPGAGRKAVHIDLKQVEKLCGLQCTDDELASFFGVSARTIERRKNQTAFAEAGARGKERGVCRSGATCGGSRRRATLPRTFSLRRTFSATRTTSRAN